LTGENFVPLEFLRRKGGEARASKAAPEPQAHVPVPEEAVAQEHQLRLTFGAKTSNGVRLQGGPHILAALPVMLDDIGITETEVVEPRATNLAAASPSIIRTEEAGDWQVMLEAGDWLRAHGANSPITRHALYVLESLDAIDPAYDTFACALLDGHVDPAGYPEYAAVVGGVAAHWDESTGDLIVRALVGWGGRGARGDTDRIAGRLLGRLLGNILESGDSLGLTGLERPSSEPGGGSLTCPHCGYPAVSPRAIYCPKCGMRMLHS